MLEFIIIILILNIISTIMIILSLNKNHGGLEKVSNIDNIFEYGVAIIILLCIGTYFIFNYFYKKEIQK